MKKEFRITVKAIIFNEGKILLLRRKMASRDGHGFWELPGGGLKFGETLEEALQREVLEETGLEINVIQPVYTFSALREEKNLQKIGIAFLCSCRELLISLSNEHSEFGFFSRVEAKDLLSTQIYKEVESKLY